MYNVFGASIHWIKIWEFDLFQMSYKHYGESAFVCPVCSSPVHPIDDFVQLSDAAGFKPKTRQEDELVHHGLGLVVKLLCHTQKLSVTMTLFNRIYYHSIPMIMYS